MNGGVKLREAIIESRNLMLELGFECPEIFYPALVQIKQDDFFSPEQKRDTVVIEILSSSHIALAHGCPVRFVFNSHGGCQVSSAWLHSI